MTDKTINTVPATTDAPPARRRSAWAAIIRLCQREPLGTFGIVIVIIMAVAGCSAELIAP